MATLAPAGDFRTSYRADMTIFPTRGSRLALWLGLALVAASPLVFGRYELGLLINIGIMGIAALGLNILVGFTGQISIGHAAFFGFGAFASAYAHDTWHIPVVLCIPLAGIATALVGLVFGAPAARLKGLYLAIATLAAQFILEDFFARAQWFTGGVAGRITEPFALFGWVADREESFLYVVLAWVILMFLGAANLLRTRDGRALVAVRDHYLSAEMMGINLAYYRTLSFGIASFYAGIAGALYAHYLLFVSVEAFNILFSIQFLGMVIIGGLGSVMGSLMGAAFMVLLPEVVQAGADALAGSAIDHALKLGASISFLREMAVGAAIILFLIFEPDGLAHRWRLIKAYWKLYPFSH
ncbi:branched-chain amino acid ABC transporter permease [Siccirubricoccus sp. KC 17139]|uniref:Branched-chain amino acid ABC transporter permease n=1 Tax=Siccirubricoccus soli TaxID=2899147 RepID=A0ABT1D6V7_9PROT|nr:branched-chain amino acid ABC transporter permease [Siccirubricoccus soli]MCO6417669.1 branched-chain amino acid ABC transporter permease [Siccirubricoccus soli]MCP2683804.1 branched-chain amino acid ABC transporter permease [Siccirubricoccus soli]